MLHVHVCRCDISLVAPPFSPPTVPQDPNFGGLRFTLRVENAYHRWGAGLPAGWHRMGWVLCAVVVTPKRVTDVVMHTPPLTATLPLALPAPAHRRGCAEEVYYIIAPRHPRAPRTLVSTGTVQGEETESAMPAAVALPTRRWTTGEASVVH